MKKFMKMSGIVFLALMLACTTAVAVDTGKTASAATKAKTLKMKKKKVTITVGQKVKLGVTVKPKKAKIKWSSNKKKIATVSKKGEVTGKKKGTAKITAKSGKKKAVCTVKVNAAQAGIKSVAVTNSKIVRVTLTKAVSLKTANFAVKKKANGKGAYNTTLKVANITKVNSKVYELNLYTDPAIGEAEDIWDTNRIYEGDYVQVTVKKLKGNKTGETIYYASNYASNTYAQGLVGQKFESGFGFSQSCVGYVSGIKVTGVPKGLTAKAYGDIVYVAGTPTEAKASVMTFTGKDELGKKLTQKVYFYIGSDNVMLSYTRTEGRTILANDNESEEFYIYTVGGSGDYTRSLNGNTNKLINISGRRIVFGAYTSNGNGTRTYLNPGTYNVSYTVKDDKGHSNTGTLSVTAVKGVMVSGKVRAGDNSGLTKSATVHASFKDEKEQYYSSDFSESTYSAGEPDQYNSSVKKADGDYNMIVYPSQVYNFTAYSSGITVYADSKRIGTANTTLDFKMPIYKVTLVCGSDDLSELYWDFVDSDRSEYGKILYLKKGSYKLRATSSGGFFEYTANFTVNGNCTVNVTKKSLITVSGTWSVGASSTISLTADRTSYYAFTPTANGDYTFTLEGVGEYDYCSVALVDATTGEYLAYGHKNYASDADGNETVTVVMDMEGLTAGKTYYISLNPDGSYSNLKATISNKVDVAPPAE